MTDAQRLAATNLYAYARSHVETLFQHYQHMQEMRCEERCGPMDVANARREWQTADRITKQARDALMEKP